MTFILQSPSHGAIHFSNDIPNQFSDLVKPGVPLLSANESFGDFLLQPFSAGDFTHQMHYYFPKESISVKEFLDGPFVYVTIVLNGTHLLQTIDGLGEVVLNDWQYYIFYTEKGTSVTTTYKKGTTAQYFTMRLSMAHFHQVTQAIPPVAGLFSSLTTCLSFLFSDKPRHITPLVPEVINGMLKQRFDNNAHQLYFLQLKAGEILFYLISEQVNRPQENITEKEMEVVFRAKTAIQEKITDPPSERQLAVRVSTNLYKLKRLFKEVLGQTIAEFTISSRLEYGRKLLQTTHMSIKEISAICGYKSTHSFTTAFGKKYSVTPDVFRRMLL